LNLARQDSQNIVYLSNMLNDVNDKLDSVNKINLASSNNSINKVRKKKIFEASVYYKNNIIIIIIINALSCLFLFSYTRLCDSLIHRQVF